MEQVSSFFLIIGPQREQAKHDAISRSMVNINKAIDSSSNPFKIQHRFKITLKTLAHAAKKWLPAGKVLYLDTLVTEHKQVHKPNERLKELGAYWAQTFSYRTNVSSKADKYLKTTWC